MPDAFASDPDRLARLRREAQVLASLNHPNIAHVYGLEQADGVQALVMELVQGPTLGDRIARGPIHLDEALPMAMQLPRPGRPRTAGDYPPRLEAGEYQGASRRHCKVLDFALAKVMEPAGTTSSGLSPRSVVVQGWDQELRRLVPVD